MAAAAADVAAAAAAAAGAGNNQPSSLEVDLHAHLAHNLWGERLMLAG